MRRALWALAVVVVAEVVAPEAAAAHDGPESKSSQWVMADWMMYTFFVFAGLALVAFLVAWRAGHFHDLEQAARIPLGIEEQDYYSPEWAQDEEEWDDVHADR